MGEAQALPKQENARAKNTKLWGRTLLKRIKFIA
jgi:hypothetical protein